MPVYSKFHIEVHLRKLFYSTEKQQKIKKLLVNFFYYVFIVSILSEFAVINFWCSMNTKDVFSM